MSFDYDDELEHIEVDERAWEKAFEEEKTSTRSNARTNARTGARAGAGTGAGTGTVAGSRIVDDDIDRKARATARSMARQKKIAKNKRKRRIITAIVAEILTLLFIFGYAYVYKIYSKPQRLEFKQDNIKNEELSVDDIQKMKGYWMIAIFGVDSRGTNVGKGTNADVNMIACINQDTGDIKLVSVYRDTYLNIDDKGSYNKINQAYAVGGPEQAVRALNKNLDLNITDYITFNWKGVADAINILGGVDVEITKSEFKYINSFITETVKTTGIGSHQLKSSGMNHLDGVQAVAYGRLRLMDTDYARTERQRKIIQLAFDKAKAADYSVLNNILVVVLPQVATSLSFSDLTNVALNITKYKLGETGGFPFAKGDANMGKKGACVIPQTLESNVVELHKFLFGDEGYTTTDTVKKISSKVASDTGMYSQGKSQTGSQIPKDKDEPETSEIRETSKEETSSIAETDEFGNPIITRPFETDEDGNPIISGPFETDANGNIIPNYTTAEGESTTGESESGDRESTSESSNRPTNPTNPTTRPTGPADLPTSPTSATKPTETVPPETTSGGPGQGNEPTEPQPSTSFGPVATEPESTTSGSNPGGSPGGSPGTGTTSPVTPGGAPGDVIGNDGPG